MTLLLSFLSYTFFFVLFWWAFFWIDGMATDGIVAWLSQNGDWPQPIFWLCASLRTWWRGCASHRYAVCCHSPILNALFTSGCEDSQKQTVELHDFDTVVVSKMLSLIYEGLDNSTSSAALHLLAVRGDGTAKSGLLRSPKTPLRGYVKEHSCEFSGQTDPTSSRYSPFLLPFT